MGLHQTLQNDRCTGASVGTQGWVERTMALVILPRSESAMAEPHPWPREAFAASCGLVDSPNIRCS